MVRSPFHHPPHQPRKHLRWTALHKLRQAVSEHVLHVLRLTDEGGVLLQEVVFDFLGVSMEQGRLC